VRASNHELPFPNTCTQTSTDKFLDNSSVKDMHRSVGREMTNRVVLRAGSRRNDGKFQYIMSPRLPLRFYIDAGSDEIDPGGHYSILEPSRHMSDVLLAKGYEVHYREFVGDTIT
jgi:hypothetical protein